MVEEANKYCELAVEALVSGQFEAAQIHMDALGERYKIFCNSTADEAQEQRQEENSDQGLADKPREDDGSTHCRQPSED